MPAPGTPLLLRIDADAAIDGTGIRVAPATMLLRIEPKGEALPGVPHGPLQLLALGHPAEVDCHRLGGEVRRLDRRGTVLIPALVNAHSHLDLTHIGTQPFEPSQGFMGFVRIVIPQRLSAENAIVESVRRGVELSLRGGVVAVGDIGGVAVGKPTLAPSRALARSPLMGTSYVEFFALGQEEASNLQLLAAALGEWLHWRVGDPGFATRIRLGISPHAPYTVSPAAYAMAAEFAKHLEAEFGEKQGIGVSFCTHLAENPEERAFIGKASGPFREFHARVGNWSDQVAESIGHGLSPIAHLQETLRHAPYLLAHVNDASDEDLAILAGSRAQVAYCPRSSEYFANERHFGPHRYRDMLARGINVALGTDSVVNLPPGSDHPATGRISTLDEARRLWARDATDPVTLLDMATRRGARAIRMPEAAFTFESPGFKAGVVAVPVSGSAQSPWHAILAASTAPQLLAVGAIPADG